LLLSENMGTEFLKIIEAEEAKEIIKNLFDDVYKRESELIPVNNSYERVLSEDIISEIDLPPFDRTIMDGYAIIAEDCFGASEDNPKVLKCIDSIEAGSFSDKILKHGECIEISTGAAIPKGADAIAMVEYSENLDEEETITENDKKEEKTDETPKKSHPRKVAILKSVPPSQDISKKGSDIKKGETLLKKGDILSSVKVGVLSAQGFQKVKVYKKPIVSIISTGNELLHPGEKLSFGKVYDVNTTGIKGAVIGSGGETIEEGIVGDDFEKLKNKLEKAMKTSDIVIFSGGTSAGVGDFIKHVIEEMGEVLIHGISVKPGKPTLIGKIKNKIIICLPGNPVSAMIVFYGFIAPYIRKIAGLKEKETAKRKHYPLAKRVHSSKGRLHYQLVEIKEKRFIQ